MFALMFLTIVQLAKLRNYVDDHEASSSHLQFEQ